ncbi:hypothetical protein [Campylobacter sp.]|uniref:hypothetical protein n=1 Tax=Campylobacter sp. TaxID=205 RepID=UPI0025F27A93|nr:hypothetical protein [Campylobacter sp.]
MSANMRNFVKQNFDGLNFIAAILKFTRLKLTDLREPPFTADLNFALLNLAHD